MDAYMLPTTPHTGTPPIHGLVLASHQLLAIPANPHLYPNLVIYYDDGDSSYIHNYGSKYALQHGCGNYPLALKTRDGYIGTKAGIAGLGQ